MLHSVISLHQKKYFSCAGVNYWITLQKRQILPSIFVYFLVKISALVPLAMLYLLEEKSTLFSVFSANGVRTNVKVHYVTFYSFANKLFIEIYGTFSGTG